MTIQELLGRLDVVGVSGKETICKCPVPSCGDSSGHLYVSEESGKRILFCNHGKPHDVREYADALGVSVAELLYNEPSGGDKKPQRKRTAPKQTPKSAQKSAPSPAPRKQWGTIDKVYSYQDESGQEIFQKVRYRDPKGFMQRHYDPSDPTAKRDGYVNSVPDDANKRMLYRMPELKDAIRKRMVIFYVEGEKDVENLRALGYASTTIADGSDFTGDKFTENHAELLRGADVVLLADVDPETDDKGKPNYKGQKFMYHVAAKLLGIAQRVRLCDDLRRYDAQLKDKGDISDVLEDVGADETRRILRQLLIDTPDFDPKATRYWMDEREQLRERVEGIPGYAIENGCICKKVKDGGLVELTDFTAAIRRVVIRDNGVEQVPFFEVQGWNQFGQRIRKDDGSDVATVKVSEFAGMGWLAANWKLSANIMPVNLAEKSVAYVIRKSSQNSAESMTEYLHTGWREIDGRWVYLHGGGAIGGSDVKVGLDGALRKYDLTVPEGARTDYEAALATLQILDTIDKRVSCPLLATVFGSPLREFYIRGGCAPSYALFLLGSTNTGKTVASALALSHFGDFTYHDSPASFKDTANYITRKAFILKDMPLLIDDLHPTSVKQERDSMIKVMEAVAAAAGDGTSRGRLDSAMNLRADTPPRCMAIVTGEDMPTNNQSRIARYYIVHVKEGDVPLSAKDPRHDLLDLLQGEARAGALRQSMNNYIKWLSERTDTLPDELREEHARYRRRAALAMVDGHLARSSEMVGHMMVSYLMLLRWLNSEGVLTADEVVDMSEDAFQVFTEESNRQSIEVMSQRPSKMFMEILRELKVARSVFMKAANGTGTTCGEKDPPVNSRMVGYYDTDHYYLLPEMAYTSVVEQCKRQDLSFPLSKNGLMKQLREDKLLSGWGKTANTVTRKLDGQTQRVLMLKRKLIDGDDAAQIEMEELNPDELPAEVSD